MSDIPGGSRKVTGLKQTKKAVLEKNATAVYIAADADPRVTAPLRRLCAEAKIEVRESPSMKELGLMCGIEVGAAAAALLK